ncbi:hypothetical protein ACQ4PT_023278 [Festuca glaucescens]
MMSEWELKSKKAAGNVEIEMSSQFDELVAGVISRMVFRGDHRAANGIHLAQELQFLVFSSMFKFLRHIPGFRYLPTKGNLKMCKLQKELRDILTNIVKNRLSAKVTTCYGNGMLGVHLLLLGLDTSPQPITCPWTLAFLDTVLGRNTCTAENGHNLFMSMDEIIEECKTFYLAGQETTSQLFTWTMFLLSTCPEWQEKLREEVLRKCGKEISIGDTLNKLKLVNMFILETLRLYCPVPQIQRKASLDLELGCIKVPEGAILLIPIKPIHDDKEVWGEDAGEFKPQRFENGRFSISLSPNPSTSMPDTFTVRPRYGLQVVLKSL